MKKIKALFLCLSLSAVFAFAGCGKAIDPDIINKVNENKDAILVDIVATDTDKNAILEISDEDYAAKEEAWEKYDLKFKDKEVFLSAVSSYIAAEEEAGKATLVSKDFAVTGNAKDGYKAAITLGCTERAVNMNIAYDTEMNVTDITFSPVYSIGEAMTKAALNTLLGMGSVFCVLILIMCIIYLFGIIPKIQKSLDEKKANKEKSATEKSVDKTIEKIVEKEEGDLVDDTELVAVISAAIAAYEGNTSADGFVVRSIRKSQSKKWQNAQY